MVNRRVRNAVLGCNLKNDRMISVRLQGKPFNITVIQVYAPTSNAEEAEVERFYEDLQDLLELTPQKDVLFIIGDWNAKVGTQETPTGKFGLGMNSMKRQKNMTVVDKPSRWEGIQYATGVKWIAITNSSRKNEAAGPKREKNSAVDVSGGKSKV